MDELMWKTAFTYGPLMLFFLAVGFALYKWLPPAFTTLTNAFREMVAALNSSTVALNNSTAALNSNNDALKNHQEVASTLREMWAEMRERMDSFECQNSLIKARAPKKVKIMNLRKTA